MERRKERRVKRARKEREEKTRGWKSPKRREKPENRGKQSEFQKLP